jgi:hypothetical protein
MASRALSIFSLVTLTIILAHAESVRSDAETHNQAQSRQIRLLHFPADRSLGVLYIRDVNSKGRSWEDWNKFAEAVGDVTIPTGSQLRLDISKAAVNDLSPLTALHPDAVHTLMLWQTQAEDDAFRHVANLTGLQELTAEGTRITDQGVRYLLPLRSLKRLYLGSTTVGDAGLAHVSKLPALESLSLWQTQITDRALAHVSHIKSLKSLGLGDTDISDAGLRIGPFETTHRPHMAPILKQRYYRCRPQTPC